MDSGYGVLVPVHRRLQLCVVFRWSTFFPVTSLVRHTLLPSFLLVDRFLFFSYLPLSPSQPYTSLSSVLLSVSARFESVRRFADWKGDKEEGREGSTLEMEEGSWMEDTLGPPTRGCGNTSWG